MNNDELRIFVNFVANKNQSGNTLSPASYQSLLQRMTIEYFEKLLGTYESDQKETNSIRRFKISDQTIELTDGIGALPVDYKYVSGSTFKYKVNSQALKYRKVDLVSDKEFDYRVSSSIEYPTMRNPIAKLVGSTIMVKPVTIQNIQMGYLREPYTPTFLYTLDANDNLIYNTASVELDFEEHDKLKIAGLILSYMGINLREQDLFQYGKQIENEN